MDEKSNDPLPVTRPKLTLNFNKGSASLDVIKRLEQLKPRVIEPVKSATSNNSNKPGTPTNQVKGVKEAAEKQLEKTTGATIIKDPKKAKGNLGITTKAFKNADDKNEDKILRQDDSQNNEQSTNEVIGVGSQEGANTNKDEGEGVNQDSQGKNPNKKGKKSKSEDVKKAESENNPSLEPVEPETEEEKKVKAEKAARKEKAAIKAKYYAERARKAKEEEARKEALARKIWLIDPKVYKQMILEFREKFPGAFSVPKRAFAITLHAELIRAQTEHSNGTIRKFLQAYCLDSAYRDKVILGAERFNLKGEVTSLVTAEELAKDKRLLKTAQENDHQQLRKE